AKGDDARAHAAEGDLNHIAMEEANGETVDEKKDFIDTRSQLLDDALRSGKWDPYVSDSGVVTRGINLDGDQNTVVHDLYYAHAKSGEELTDSAFTSTTFGAPFDKDTVIVYTLEPGHGGKDVTEMSKYPDEKEVLFPRGSSFTIQKIIEPGDPDFAA